MRKPILLGLVVLLVACTSGRCADVEEICRDIYSTNTCIKAKIALIDVLGKLGSSADGAICTLTQIVENGSKRPCGKGNTGTKDKPCVEPAGGVEPCEKDEQGQMDKDNLLRIHAAKALGDIVPKATDLAQAIKALEALAKAKGRDTEVDQAADAAILLITQAISKPAKTAAPAPAPVPTPPCPPTTPAATLDSLITVLGDKTVDANVRILVAKNLGALATQLSAAQKCTLTTSINKITTDSTDDKSVQTAVTALNKQLASPGKPGKEME